MGFIRQSHLSYLSVGDMAVDPPEGYEVAESRGCGSGASEEGDLGRLVVGLHARRSQSGALAPMRSGTVKGGRHE